LINTKNCYQQTLVPVRTNQQRPPQTADHHDWRITQWQRTAPTTKQCNLPKSSKTKRQVQY